MERKQYTVFEKINHVKNALKAVSINSYSKQSGVSQSNIHKWKQALEEGRLSESNAVAVSSSIKTKVFMVDGVFFTTFEAAAQAAGLKGTASITEYDMVKIYRPVTKTVVEWK